MAGVGTELQKIIPSLFKFKGCKCQSTARRYDQWGVRKCKLQRDFIIDELLIRSSQVKYAKHLPHKITRPILTRWVDTAIERASRNVKR